jgi:hypothetical protein
VFAYATDPNRFSELQQGVVDGHMDGPTQEDGPPAVGSKCVDGRLIRCRHGVAVPGRDTLANDGRARPAFGHARHNNRPWPARDCHVHAPCSSVALIGAWTNAWWFRIPLRASRSMPGRTPWDLASDG